MRFICSSYDINNNMNSDIEQIPAMSHSLQADMVTGWKPKLKIIGPMPLNFDNPLVDKSIMALIHQQSAFYEVVYLGPRPNSSFKLHELLAKRYRYKYGYLLHNDFAHLKPFFKKFYSLFEPQAVRPYCGMNPSVSRRQVVFDSCFEGGNLDSAVRLRAHQYDLLLRVDSNTAGHVLWYHFRMANAETVGKVVRLNLCNLRRNKSAYERGMRPFVKREGAEWRQEGENVEVTCQRLRYLKQNLSANMEQNQLQQTSFRKLSFEIALGPAQSVQIAYSVPYSYSLLLEHLAEFKKKARLLPGVQFECDYQHESLSGLQIPVVKIRMGAAGNGKYCVFMIGRQHPGESNSSHVIKGTIEQLLGGGEVTMRMLKHCDFVIIPMVNPDGVVAGNFRTSLFGKDLNRLFKTKDTTLIPEVEMVRGVFSQQYEIYKKKLLLFLDYHGHSTRKNAFLLGPGIVDAQLLTEIRTLPKMMPNFTEMFRYPSCSFRLEASKKTTARALFGKLAGLSFTIEASNWAYYSQETKEVVMMQGRHFQELGAGLFKGVEQYILMKLQAKGKYDLRMKEDNSKKLKSIKSRNDLKLRKSVTSREKTDNIRKNKDPRVYTETLIAQNEIDAKRLSHIREESLVREELRIKEDRPPSVQEANSSDEMSDNGMDSDSQGEDMEDGRFKKYIKAASQMLVEFQMMYYGDLYRKGISKYRGADNTKSNKLLFQRDKRRKIEPIQACLRQSEKKPETAFKTEDQLLEQRQQRRRVFLEDAIFGKDKSRQKQEVVEKEDMKEIAAEEKKEGKRFKFLQPSRNGKVKISSLMRGETGLSQQVTRFRKIELINLEGTGEARKRDKSLQKIKNSPNSNIHIIINRQKEPTLGMGLPFIRGSKALPEQGYNNSNSSSNLVPKTKGKFNDLLASEQLLNKSAVINVLKLSLLDKQKSYKKS